MLTIVPSWLFATVIVLSISCFFIYTLSQRNPSFAVPNPKFPPSPRKLPIIGNLHQLLGKHRHQILWRLSQKYGPVMLLHFGSKPFLVISSSTMAKQVFKTHDHMLCTRSFFQGTKRLTYNYLDIAFSPHDDHWKEMRKILVTEFLGPKRARLFNHVTEMEIKDMVHSLSLHPPNTAVNLDDKFLALTNAIVCKVAFGKSYKEEPFSGATVKEMINEATVMLSGSFGDTFPIFGWILDEIGGWNSRLQNCFGNMDGYFQSILSEHIDNTAEEMNESEKDFIHALLELWSNKTTSHSSQLTMDDMKALMMDVFLGGIDSTSVTMVWAMSEIVRDSRVMQKLQAEIRSCIGIKPEVHASDITKMTYLKMVLKETLRLHPPAPLLIPHECISHCQIGGYDVFPGTGILINAWGIGREEGTWSLKPTEFYPERFEDVDVDYVSKHFEMVPFGGGRRTCPGYNSALGTIEFTLVNLLYWFDWEVPGGVKNESLNMEEDGSLVVRKKMPLCLVPIKKIWRN
ncbi:hypothetical protein L2E82_32552 [Cichorium intybus]|uniref:Uncharacterized protein n=1 Tax=Cichorium intybus TaxID=13427 RepID=A0ACB9BH43_CICIN|nr:hypothetical protein L2E82_32552 [Cichorium intybus]